MKSKAETIVIEGITMYPTTECAQLLNMSVITLRRKIASKTIKGVRLGKAMYVSDVEIKRYLTGSNSH